MPRKKKTQNISEEGTRSINSSAIETKAKKVTALKNSAIPGWVIAGVLLIIVVAMFVYAQSSLSKVNEGKKEIEGQTRVLKSTVNNLQQEVSDLNQKAENLEQSSKKSEEFFFNQEIAKRKIPDTVDTKDWQLFKDDDWRMSITYPQNWQISKTAEPTKTEAGEQKAETRKSIALEPVGVSEYLRSVQIMPYDFGQPFSIDEKLKVFDTKEVLDTQDFNGGKLVYFIERAENLIVPTIMILSDHGDYKVIFMVNNVLHSGFFTYLEDFEKILAVTKLEPAPAPEPAAEEPKEAEAKEE